MNNNYKSTSYINKINSKQVLILDIDDQYDTDKKYILGSSKKFKINLQEPITIDNISELYLDNVITYNCNTTNDNDNSAFIVNLDQFNVKTNVASNSNYAVIRDIQYSNGNSVMSNNIIIPNENNDINNYYSCVLHKSKKLNYLADIPAGRFDHLSGTITNLNGDPIFHGQNKSNNYTYMLQNINWKWNGMNDNFSGSEADGVPFDGNYNGSITNIKKNSEFVLSPGSASGISCVLLNDTRLKASQILFSTSASHTIVLDHFSNCSNINMMLSSSEITSTICDEDHGGTPHLSDTSDIILKGLQNKNLDNMNLSLTKRPNLVAPADSALGNPELYYESGRFLAEFTIIEKK